MPRSSPEEIVVDFLDHENWSEEVVGGEVDPDLDLPPLPPQRAEAA